MKWLKAGLCILCLASASSYAKKNEELKKNFTGNILMVESLAKVWIQFEDKESYSELSASIPLRNKRNKYLAMPVYIYGVNKQSMKDIEDKDRSKEFKGFVGMKSSVEGKLASINCFGEDKREGIPLCQVKVNGVDLGNEIISYGISYFYPDESLKGIGFNDKYKQTEVTAKNNGVGIWEPYYSMGL